MSPSLRRLFSGRGSGLELSQSLGAFPLPGGGISPLHVVFTVTNAGRGATSLDRAYVTAESDGAPTVPLPEGDRALPATLGPGETAKLWLRAKPLARSMKEAGIGGRPRLRFVVEGDSGVHGLTFGFKVDEYLRLKDE